MIRSIIDGLLLVQSGWPGLLAKRFVVFDRAMSPRSTTSEFAGHCTNGGAMAALSRIVLGMLLPAGCSVVPAFTVRQISSPIDRPATAQFVWGRVDEMTAGPASPRMRPVHVMAGGVQNAVPLS